jgi:hypothetical protein
MVEDVHPQSNKALTVVSWRVSNRARVTMMSICIFILGWWGAGGRILGGFWFWVWFLRDKANWSVFAINCRGDLPVPELLWPVRHHLGLQWVLGYLSKEVPAIVEPDFGVVDFPWASARILGAMVGDRDSGSVLPNLLRYRLWILPYFVFLLGLQRGPILMSPGVTVLCPMTGSPTPVAIVSKSTLLVDLHGLSLSTIDLAMSSAS